MGSTHQRKRGSRLEEEKGQRTRASGITGRTRRGNGLLIRRLRTAAARAAAAVVAPIPLPLRAVLRFFLPLAATYTIMMATHLIMNAGLARTSSPEISIAAFAVGMSVIGLFEAPALVMRSASISLGRSESAFRIVSRVAYVILGVTTAVMAAIAFSPAGTWMFKVIFGVPDGLVGPSLLALRMGVLVPVISGLRLLYQGAIIYRRETGVLTVGIVVRLLLMWVLIAVLLRQRWADDVSLGLWAFLTGIATEMVVAIAWVRRRREAWRKRDRVLQRGGPETATDSSAAASATGGGDGSGPSGKASPPAASLQAGDVLRFVLPFTAAILAETFYRPTVNAGLGRAPDAAYGLAAFAIAWTMAHLIINGVKNLHQIVMVFGDEPAGMTLARRVCWGGGALGGVSIAFMALSPVGHWFFRSVLGVGPELAAAAVPTLLLFSLQALIMGMEQGVTGRLLLARQTKWVSLGRGINLLTVAFTIGVLVTRWPGLGARAGALALTAGTGAETAYLLLLERTVAARWERRPEGAEAAVGAGERR